MKEVELKPIKETTEDFERLEEMIGEIFRKEIYIPLLREVNTSSKVLKNSTDDLLEAISSGRINFANGRFTGNFNATISRELKKLGAKWERSTESFRLPKAKLTAEMKNAIDLSQARFAQKLAAVDRKLRDMLPEKIATKLDANKFFDTTLWKTDESFKKTVKGITVPPDLTKERRARIAKEYTENLQLYIKEWTEKEIVELRKDVQKAIFSGNRYESLIKSIQKSYDVSQNKAKFLARQETSLLMTKFKETRYTDAGVMEYRWGCVAGSPNHPVRPMHKALEGKVFRWDDPPVTDEKGNRNNPGQDYNCRCFARPIVRF